MKILVIEDEPAIRRGLVDAVRFGGFAVEEAADGEEGLQRALAPGQDLVLLDLMLPKRDGFSVLTELRKAKPRLPVIILTARGAEDDRVRGLKAGADDYVVKPFSARELLARVEAVLRRSAERPLPVRLLRMGDTAVDLERSSIRRESDETAELTPKEVELLSYLAQNPDRALSRQELLERVWGVDTRGLDTRAVDMLVARLRSKLGDAGPSFVVTVRGKGYRMGDGVARSGESP